MAGLFDWSTTAASNTTVDGVSIAEGMSAGNVNNAIRGLMAKVRASFAAGLESFLAGTAGLGIASGGTGATTAPTALSNLGGLSSTYRNAVMTTKTGAFTFADSDRGNGIRYTGAAAAGTLSAYATVAIEVGGVIPIRVAHNASGALAVTPGGAATIRIAGQTASVASVSFAIGSFGGIYHEATDLWVAYGNGIS